MKRNQIPLNLTTTSAGFHNVRRALCRVPDTRKGLGILLNYCGFPFPGTDLNDVCAMFSWGFLDVSSLEVNVKGK